MRRIKEVLRLRYELGLGQRQIARSCSIGQSTVFDYLKRAEVAGLRWPLRDDWDDERLERSLFAYGQHEQPSPQRPQPDFESIHEQLKRHSVQGRRDAVFLKASARWTRDAKSASDPERKSVQ